MIKHELKKKNSIARGLHVGDLIIGAIFHLAWVKRLFLKRL
jgi:hypothetical protein